MSYLRAFLYNREERDRQSYLNHFYNTLHIYHSHDIVLVGLPNVYAASGVIHTPITGKTAAIFEEVLKCRDTQHEHHRDHGNLLAEGIDCRYPIKQHDKNKIQIGHTVKLF